MASSPITLWQIDWETMERVADFIVEGSKITADDDCSHEIKRRLLLGRKVMTNLDSILKSRDITLWTKVSLVKAMVFPVVMYGCESWTIKKAERQRIDAFELWCWRRLSRVPWTARRSNQFILKEIGPGCWLGGLMLKRKLQCFGHLMWKADSSKRPWCWEWLRAREEGENRGWDGWMPSPTQWTWVCVGSRSWWWTGRPGVLQFMGSQSWTRLNWTELNLTEKFPWFTGRPTGGARTPLINGKRFLRQVLGKRLSRRPQEGGGCLLISFIGEFESSETSFQRVWPERKGLAAQRPSWCSFDSALRSLQSEPPPETFCVKASSERCISGRPMNVVLSFRTETWAKPFLQRKWV